MSHLIRQHDWHQVLVFTRTKHGANRLAEKLVKDGIEAAAIHGNKSQGARTKALADFKNGSVKVLVATDIAARGLDIDQLPQVVNFELPNVSEDYVHRIGRTGRAGSTGAAISLVDEEELKLLKGIERLIKREIPRVTVEGFVPSEKAAEAPRPPRPAQGQRRGQGQGQRQGRGDSQSQNQRPAQGQAQPRGRDGRKPARAPQNPQNQQGRNGNARPAASPDAPSKSAQPMSEAARHQAMPQSPLFAPKPVHRGNRGR